MQRSTQRGRIPEDQREARRRGVLEAAIAELIERGVAGVTMQGVARRAGASKETLYAWFGNREELLSELMKTNADSSAQSVAEALQRPAQSVEDARVTLTAYGCALLELLTSPASIALNRAAMTSPHLAQRLLALGRYRIGPLVEAYLQQLDDNGLVRVADPAEAFRTLYGLVVRDTQIIVLLGGPVPTAAELSAEAAKAVEQFIALLVE